MDTQTVNIGPGSIAGLGDKARSLLGIEPVYDVINDLAFRKWQFQNPRRLP
jgi:hypothetical protein